MTGKALTADNVRVEHLWHPLTPRQAAETLSGLPIRWWIAGGWALDLECGRGTRPHKDVDIAVLRGEHEALRTYLAGWDLQIAYLGRLRPWLSGPVGPPENAVWARPRQTGPWWLDVKIEETDDGNWVYRCDATIRRPLEKIGRTSREGIPYLDPAIVRLYKMHGRRPAAYRAP